MKKNITAVIMAVALCVASSAHADVVLQLDFGNAGTYVGNLAPAGVSDTIWNGVPNGDVFSGLVYGDGSAATGISVELGAAVTPGNAINFLTDDARSDAGNIEDQGVAIYDTDLTDDWVFDSSNADLGARITGLAAGVYDVYAVTREPNQLTRTYDVGIGTFAAADANNISSGSAQLTTTAVGDATGATAFIAGQNFAVTRVTITDSTDFIGIVVDPTNERFATLGAVQIVGVAVPEPSSLALLSIGGLGFILRRRR